MRHHVSPDVAPAIASEMAAAIGERLDRVEAEHGVRLPLAVESGSRAWGFPSPDSDYDCRFIFVRGEDAYLTLHPRRDVIELPLRGELDVNGWDLAKALRLMLKGPSTGSGLSCWNGCGRRSPTGATRRSGTRSSCSRGSARTGA